VDLGKDVTQQSKASIQQYPTNGLDYYLIGEHISSTVVNSRRRTLKNNHNWLICITACTICGKNKHEADN